MSDSSFEFRVVKDDSGMTVTATEVAGREPGP
jgi:hypothetical protein